jgi:hypothetical protein
LRLPDLCSERGGGVEQEVCHAEFDAFSYFRCQWVLDRVHRPETVLVGAALRVDWKGLRVVARELKKRYWSCFCVRTRYVWHVLVPCCRMCSSLRLFQTVRWIVIDDPPKASQGASCVAFMQVGLPHRFRSQRELQTFNHAS